MRADIVRKDGAVEADLPDPAAWANALREVANQLRDDPEQRRLFSRGLDADAVAAYAGVGNAVRRGGGIDTSAEKGCGEEPLPATPASMITADTVAKGPPPVGRKAGEATKTSTMAPSSSSTSSSVAAQPGAKKKVELGGVEDDLLAVTSMVRPALKEPQQRTRAATFEELMAATVQPALQQSQKPSLSPARPQRGSHEGYMSVWGMGGRAGDRRAA